MTNKPTICDYRSGQVYPDPNEIIDSGENTVMEGLNITIIALSRDRKHKALVNDTIVLYNKTLFQSCTSNAVQHQALFLTSSSFKQNIYMYEAA